MTEKRGFFITFEGPEGAGKSSQIARLDARLRAAGRETLVTREPGGTPLAEFLRGIVKHHTGDEPIYPATELLLFAAARAQHVQYRIVPALAAGKVVLCDRFYDSTEAYQGAGRALDPAIVAALRRLVCTDCAVDLTILLDLPPELGLARAGVRNNPGFDRLENEALEFHRRVREGFLAIARREPARVKLVRADRERDAISEEIMELVNHAIR